MNVDRNPARIAIFFQLPPFLIEVVRRVLRDADPPQRASPILNFFDCSKRVREGDANPRSSLELGAWPFRCIPDN